MGMQGKKRKTLENLDFYTNEENVTFGSISTATSIPSVNTITKFFRIQ